jgi:hypothetical protein
MKIKKPRRSAFGVFPDQTISKRWLCMSEKLCDIPNFKPALIKCQIQILITPYKRLLYKPSVIQYTL